MYPRLLVCVSLSLLLFKASAQTTIHVPADQLHIQDAINASHNGDTILVDPGTYTENIDFTGKAITVASTGGAASTIIDGNSQGPAVTFKTGELRSSVLSGFTLRNGGSTNSATTAVSAGIYVATAAPAITNNTITGSICTGIYVFAGGALIQGNTINSVAGSTSANCINSDVGLGITLSNSPQGVGTYTNTVSGNTITNNNYPTSTAGAISVSQAEGTLIQNNVIYGNTGGGTGGISVSLTSAVSILQNLIYGNTNKTSGILTAGGLIYNVFPFGGGPIQGLIAGNTIANNLLGYSNNFQGATQVSFEGNLEQTAMIDNIVVGNSSANPAINVYQNYGPTSLQVLVLDHNDIYNSQGGAYCSYCTNVTGFYGNISADPKFTNPVSGNYHLQGGSPAIDAGNNSVPMVATQDLDGNPRVQDTTSLGYPVIDMGVYEYTGQADAIPTSLALTPSTYTPSAGIPVTLTATVTSASGTIPAGSVTFYEDGSSRAIGTLDASGTITFNMLQPSQLTPGVHSFYAKYAGRTVGTTVYPPSQSVLLYLYFSATTGTTSPSVSVVSSAPTSPVGQTVAYTATVTSTGGVIPAGSVQFYAVINSSGANILLGTSTLDGAGSASIYNSSLAAGAYTITAVYVPDSSSTFITSRGTLNPETITASPSQTNVVLTASPNPAIAAQPVTITANISSINGAPVPAGAVVFYSDGNVIGGPNTGVQSTTSLTTYSLTVGTHALYATFTANSSTITSNTVSETITSNSPTITRIAATPSPGFLQQKVNITATVTATSGSSAPVGTVAFYDNGALISGAVALQVSNGTQAIATFSTSILTLGQHPLTAIYTPSNPVFTSSTSNTYPEQIDNVSTTTAVIATPGPAFIQQQVNITATVAATGGTVSPAGSVTFYNNGTQMGAPATLLAGSNAQSTASFSTANLPLGTNRLTAVYTPSSSTFIGSTSSAYSEQISNISTAVSVKAASNPVAVQQAVNVVITVASPSGAPSPQGTVSITDNGAALGSFTLQTVAGSTQATATLSSGFALGDHAFVATYTPSSTNFTDSQSAPYTLSVINADFSLTASANPLTIQTEHHQSLTITVTSMGGFTAPVNIVCGPLPPYASCAFTNQAMNVPLNGSATTTLTIDTDILPDFKSSLEGPPTDPGSNPGRNPGRIAFALLLPAGLAAFMRRRKLGTLLLLAIFAMGTFGLSACGSKYPGHTPPGAYSIPVTVTGTIPGTAITVTHPLNLVLTVTQ